MVSEVTRLQNIRGFSLFSFSTYINSFDIENRDIVKCAKLTCKTGTLIVSFHKMHNIKEAIFYKFVISYLDIFKFGYYIIF